MLQICAVICHHNEINKTDSFNTYLPLNQNFFFVSSVLMSLMSTLSSSGGLLDAGIVWGGVWAFVWGGVWVLGCGGAGFTCETGGFEGAGLSRFKGFEGWII